MDNDANQQSYYHFDVFISYTQNSLVGKIVKEYLYDSFQETLENALEGRIPRIFVDFDGIRYGENFKTVLESALSRSIVFIPIISARYFSSDWCRKELCVAYEKWQEIIHREDKTIGSSLIFPLIIKDYTDPPKKLEHILNLDIKDCIRKIDMIGPDLFLSPEFDKWVKDIAKVVKKPPTWEEHWTKTEWINNAINKNMEYMKLSPKGPPNIGRYDG